MDIKRDLTVNEKIVELGISFLGLKEYIGKEHNHIIIDMFDTIGHSWVKDDETAWCSCFINYISQKLQLASSKKLNARSWLQIGEEIISPIPGDIIVFWRESKQSWKGHVGVFIGYDKQGNIFCLGGNQNNEVNITIYPSSKVLSFRRLNKINN